jgi:hypothetical protein
MLRVRKVKTSRNVKPTMEMTEPRNRMEMQEPKMSASESLLHLKKSAKTEKASYSTVLTVPNGSCWMASLFLLIPMLVLVQQSWIRGRKS